MGRLFVLIGKSSSGKDSVYKLLMQKCRGAYREVIPYTTRPIRDGERDGKEYFFVTEDRAREMEEAGKIIELRSYDTVHGIWKYFTADDGQICLEESDYLLIATLEAYEKLRDYFGAENVVPLYIETDDGVRLERALMRERRQKEPKYAEMCRRFLADEKDFAPEELKRLSIEKRFVNEDLRRLCEELQTYMQTFAKD